MEAKLLSHPDFQPQMAVFSKLFVPLHFDLLYCMLHVRIGIKFVFVSVETLSPGLVFRFL